MKAFISIFAVLSALLLVRPALAAGEVLPGPVMGQVLKVLDGDTMIVRARVWVGQDIEIKVRISGIDAPEMRGRCALERRRARAARDYLRARVKTGIVRLHLVQYGKYAGRVLARVETEDGVDIGAEMIRAGMARTYGGGKRNSWCTHPARG